MNRTPSSVERVGLAAYLPGLEHAANVLQEQIKSIRAALGLDAPEAAAITLPALAPAHSVGRPRKTAPATAKQPKKKKEEPQVSEKPHYTATWPPEKREAWRLKVQAAAKQRWNGMTPEVRTRMLAKMKRARMANQRARTQ